MRGCPPTYGLVLCSMTAGCTRARARTLSHTHTALTRAFATTNSRNVRRSRIRRKPPTLMCTSCRTTDPERPDCQSPKPTGLLIPDTKPQPMTLRRSILQEDEEKLLHGAQGKTEEELRCFGVGGRGVVPAHGPRVPVHPSQTITCCFLSPFWADDM